MNAVEIEQAISDLAEQPFEAASFPYAFLEAFGNKATTIQRLRTGATNKSDLAALGGVLQTGNMHIAALAAPPTPTSPTDPSGRSDVAAPSSGRVSEALKALLASPATSRAKARFVLATDGVDFEAEDLNSGDTVVCAYADFPDHFGFFLPLAGISTVRQISENSFDIRATSRLNRLYMQLLKDNPAWGRAERRHDMNHFMARLIFCFFAEDTNIFNSRMLFTNTVADMSARDSSNTHEVIGALFRAMSLRPDAERAAAGLRDWANQFPYVNGGLFSGNLDVPRFSKIARSYLLRVGALDWTRINPDIFGSMIQAVAEDEERGELGMHYTSVPNILKVLNPLFLDDLRAQLEAAGDNKIKLLNLRKRMARIRVFDPACGSGNFLVIAYKEMRAIEAEINRRRGEPEIASELPLTNYRGIELRDFSAEIARLALVIAEYQCDVLYRGHRLALNEFLPLRAENWITCGNALRLDWLSICPPTGASVKVLADDLFGTPLDQAEIDFENEGGETYICGNPPYLGSNLQTEEQKDDLRAIFGNRVASWKSLDYVAGWFMKAAAYGVRTEAATAFVSTNSICQGQQVAILWPLIFQTGHKIFFAHTSFKWANLASHNAGVTVAIVSIARRAVATRKLFAITDAGDVMHREVPYINAYLVPGANVTVEKAALPMSVQNEMTKGNQPTDGGHLLLSREEADELGLSQEQRARFIRRIYGSAEFIRDTERYCLWIEDSDLDDALGIEAVRQRVESVKTMRLASSKAATVSLADSAHRFGEVRQRGDEQVITVPSVSSETRQYLPVGLLPSGAIVSNLAFALYDAPLWNMALIASRLHLVWIGTVCGKMKSDFRYSNTLGWNTFPVPLLTEQDKADLTRCAEDILLAREAHFPATIADLYEPDKMPDNLKHAHERNDEVLERIYIGRRFKNDTERLEKLFALYTKMTSKGAHSVAPGTAPAKAAARRSSKAVSTAATSAGIP